MSKKERPQDRYDRVNTRSYTIKVVKTTEADIYEKLENVANRAGYIKQLIRADINNNKNV